MTILSDLVETRRARLRLGTNPDQFAARGEPWRMPPEEGAQLQAKTSRKINRAIAAPRAERPEFVEKPRRIPVSEASLVLRHQREVLKLMLQAGTGNPNWRTMVSPATPEEREHFRRVIAPVGIVITKDDGGFPSKAEIKREAQLHEAWLREQKAENERRKTRGNAPAKRERDRSSWPIVTR